MVQVISKLAPIHVSCIEYVHPWTTSCSIAIWDIYLYSIWASLRVYTTVYVMTLLSKGRIPTKADLQRTIYGIIQSTAFLSATPFGYTFFLCALRKLLGHFNILTVSGVPAFLASLFAIFIERPSRRLLLSLYVSNLATETLWNMAQQRNMVQPIKFGIISMFSICMAALLTYYKSGIHKKGTEDKVDPMFGILRFVVGPYEEKDYSARSSHASTFYRNQQEPNEASTSAQPGSGSWSAPTSGARNNTYHLVNQALKVYKQIITKIKCLGRHSSCPHPFSCLWYTLAGASKMFGVGLGIQVALKLIFNLNRIVTSPKAAKSILFKKDIFSLATFVCGFTGLFRAINCTLRRATGKDSPYYAIPAGLIAGISFNQYPDTTLALYVLWKLAHITYNLGVDRGVVPDVPGFVIFLYCLSTAILFNAALLEPAALRPSYWKFLCNVSGGRLACMDRTPLDIWGLGTSAALHKVFKQTNTEAVLKYIQVWPSS